MHLDRWRCVWESVSHHLVSKSWMTLPCLSLIKARHSEALLDAVWHRTNDRNRAIIYFTPGPSKTIPVVLSMPWLQQPLCPNTPLPPNIQPALAIYDSQSVVKATLRPFRKCVLIIPTTICARSSLRLSLDFLLVYDVAEDFQPHCNARVLVVE